MVVGAALGIFSRADAKKLLKLVLVPRRGINKDNKEEEYDGCCRMMGVVALAPAKRRGCAIMMAMHHNLRSVKEEHCQ